MPCVLILNVVKTPKNDEHVFRSLVRITTKIYENHSLP